MRTALLASTLACMIVATPTAALALFGFGAHGGLDFYTVDSDSQSFELAYDVAGHRAAATLLREEIDSPVMFGGRFYVDLLPIIDVELSADVALQKYTYSLTREIAGFVEMEEDEATFGRIGVYATVRKNVISLPPIVPVVSAYVGGGVGLHLIAPVLCPQLLVDELTSAEAKLDVEEYVKKHTKMGGHALVGVRVKPPMVPVALDAQAKYTIVPKGDYEEPDRFPSVYVGLMLDF